MYFGTLFLTAISALLCMAIIVFCASNKLHLGYITAIASLITFTLGVKHSINSLIAISIPLIITSSMIAALIELKVTVALEHPARLLAASLVALPPVFLCYFALTTP